MVPVTVPDIGTGLLLVDPRAPGVSLTAVPLAGHEPHHHLALTEVVVPIADLVGGRCDGEAVRDLYQVAVVAAALTADGLLSGALTLTAEYVANRRQFDRPLATLQAVAQQIIEKGYFARPYLGISFQPINPAIAARYNLPAQWGVYITRVAERSPASQAGLQEGDIIIKLGDIPIDESHSYVNALFEYNPGDQVTLEVVRGDETTQVEIILREAQQT